MRLRDRDDLLTREGLIFRVLGYDHPEGAWFCEPLYAPCSIFKSGDKRAPRLARDGGIYFKFYGDEGWRFVMERFPRYRLLHEPLGAYLVGVREEHVRAVRKPGEALEELLSSELDDELIRALREFLDEFMAATSLRVGDLGVFGSLLHGFHHPRLSDLDLTIYGRGALREAREALEELYRSGERFKNEFGTDWVPRSSSWPWKNISPSEFAWHQARKLIYGFFFSEEAGRWVKFELEPIRSWPEVENSYDPRAKVLKLGWAVLRARVSSADWAPFMPAIYGIEDVELLEAPRGGREPERVLCFVDEFRLQAFEDELILAAGWLEHVEEPEGEFYQLVLTYGPRYHEQFIKVLAPRGQGG